MLFLESSLTELYDSVVEAFPNTTARQHAIDPIVITQLQWIPFVGMKTLFVKALAQNENREYTPIIVFKNVQYRDHEAPGVIDLAASDGQVYYLEQLSREDTDVLVRCKCKDFYWRMVHYNKLDHSLYGKDRKKYEALYNPGSANPLKMPGLCKHLIKMANVLDQSYIMS